MAVVIDGDASAIELTPSDLFAIEDRDVDVLRDLVVTPRDEIVGRRRHAVDRYPVAISRWSRFWKRTDEIDPCRVAAAGRARRSIASRLNSCGRVTRSS